MHKSRTARKQRPSDVPEDAKKQSRFGLGVLAAVCASAFSVRTGRGRRGRLQRRAGSAPASDTKSGGFNLLSPLCFQQWTDWPTEIGAGITTAVVALPLAMAFGVASGAGPMAGLYGAIF